MFRLRPCDMCDDPCGRCLTVFFFFGEEGWDEWACGIQRHEALVLA